MPGEIKTKHFYSQNRETHNITQIMDTHYHPYKRFDSYWKLTYYVCVYVWIIKVTATAVYGRVDSRNL